jgi:hypothetical protein
MRRRAGLALVMLVLVALASGCAVRLAPGYDRSLVDGLAKANEDAMTLFASVSSTTRETFGAREPTYNALIGKFDALRLQSQARPTPQPLIFQVFGIGGDPKTAPKLLDAPTPKILQTVVDTLTRMRDTDRRQGLTDNLAQGFKSSYEISMDQVLTYEKALER